MQLVSIVLPTYNRAAMLHEAICSVLEQTYRQWELLIIDDGSTDDTASLFDSVKDERIRCIVLEHTGQISRLRNTGVRLAKGSLIAFLDSDDIWHNTKLEEQVKALDDYPEAGFSVTDVTTINGNEVLIQRSFPSCNGTHCLNLFPALVGNRFIIYGSVLMVRRSCLNITGLYPEPLRDGDLLFNMMLAYYYKSAVIYKPLTTRRIHESNISEELPLDYYREYLFTFRSLYQKKLITRRRWKQALSIAHLKMGQLYRAMGDRTATWTHFAKALKNNLFYPRHVLLLMRTIFRT